MALADARDALTEEAAKRPAVYLKQEAKIRAIHEELWGK